MFYAFDCPNQKLQYFSAKRPSSSKEGTGEGSQAKKRRRVVLSSDSDSDFEPEKVQSDDSDADMEDLEAIKAKFNVMCKTCGSNNNTKSQKKVMSLCKVSK